jgi:hypothetical protein
MGGMQNRREKETQQRRDTSAAGSQPYGLRPEKSGRCRQGRPSLCGQGLGSVNAFPAHMPVTILQLDVEHHARWEDAGGHQSIPRVSPHPTGRCRWPWP